VPSAFEVSNFAQTQFDRRAYAKLLRPRAAAADDTSTPSLHVFVCTRLESFRQPNGNTMNWSYILGILGITVILYLIGSFRVLRQYERGVVFFLGKFESVRGPGLTLKPRSAIFAASLGPIGCRWVSTIARCSVPCKSASRPIGVRPFRRE
jgi:hypothetical protein